MDEEQAAARVDAQKQAKLHKALEAEEREKSAPALGLSAEDVALQSELNKIVKPRVRNATAAAKYYRKRNEVLELIAQGATQYRVARFIRCTESALNRLRKMDPVVQADMAECIKRSTNHHFGKNRPLPENLAAETLDKIRGLRFEGKTQSQIAEYLGISDSMFTKWKARYTSLRYILDSPLQLPPVHDMDMVITELGPITSQQTLDVIRTWVVRGMTDESIATLLRMSMDNWERVQREIKEVGEAVRMGRAQGEEQTSRQLWAIVNDPKHPQHVSVVKYMLDKRWAKGKAAPKQPKKDVPDPTAELTPEQIMAALGETN